jgi:hypothetical protein
MQELKTISFGASRTSLAIRIQQIRMLFAKIFSIRAATAKTRRKN